MKKILSIAKIVLLLFFRRGAGWGLISLVSLFAVFIFFATSSDNLLYNELHLRIKYSLYAFTILLNIALMYFACVSLRKDIDERRFHTISAAPVHRAQIWLGKFCGIVSFGFIVFLAASAAIAISCMIFIAKWDIDKDKDMLKEKFFRTYYVCTPDLTDLQKKVEIEYEKRRKAELEKHKGHHHKEGENCEEEEEAGHVHSSSCGHDHGKWRERKYMLEEVRKEKQIIAPGKTGTWTFDWDHAAVKSDFLLLKFKFYTNKRRNKVKGVWKVLNTTGASVWEQSFDGYPFLPHEIKIPMQSLPETKRLTIAFQENSASYVIFPVFHGGIKLLYDSGGLLKNYIILVIFSILHMSVLVAIALTSSSIFSYSVAVFVTISTFLTGSFSIFFVNVVRDLSFHDDSFGKTIATFFIKVGIWITESTKAPPVNQMFADGISIPVKTLMTSWGIGFFIYMLIVMLIGIWMLTKKEIDRILQA
jgi:hypothetical protein